MVCCCGDHYDAIRLEEARKQCLSWFDLLFVPVPWPLLSLARRRGRLA